MLLLAGAAATNVKAHCLRSERKLACAAIFSEAIFLFEERESQCPLVEI
jgi:hypothetical protein